MIYLLSTIIGIALGTITGLIPGIHSNLIAAIIISLPIISGANSNTLIIILVSSAITHTFLNFIPSIFFGAPDEDSFLGVLPGHRFLMKGLGLHATKLTLIGSSIAIISLVVVIPIFIFILPKIYPLINQMMGFVLIWTFIFLLSGEKNKKEVIIIFLLSGILGLGTFNLNLENPLLPMLSGLFGISTIISSIESNASPPKQTMNKRKLEKKDVIKPTIATILISPICSLLPGLGSSQAASIGSSFFKKLKEDQFMILLGSINTLVMATSFLTLYLFGKSRTGTASAISQIVKITPKTLILIFAAILISSMIAIPLAILIARKIARKIHRISYKKISMFILITLIIISIIFSGALGLLVLLVSSALGITCHQMGVKKSFLMGSILIPTIIYYLPI